MRSVVVVLPASICAAMPMFLILSSGTVRGICKKLYLYTLCLFVLPAIMRERLVSFRHAMHVVALLDGAATEVRRVVQFVGQFVRHAFFRATAGVAQDPANGKARAAVLRYFDRNLIIRAAYAAGFYFEQWLGI